MAPKFVTPYRMSGKRGKNDAADAAAICEAVQPPEHALRAGQDRRAAGPTAGAPGPAGVCRGAHGHHQPHPRPAGEFGIVLPLKAEPCASRRPRIWKNCPAGPTPSSATCSARCTGWTSASPSTTATSMQWPGRTPAQQLMRCMGVGETTATALWRWSATATTSRRPAAQRLARPGARAVQLGRQDAAGAHHQGGRRLPAQPADHGRAGGAERGQGQDRRVSRWAWRWPSGAATGRRWWRSRRRTRAWPGRCSPRARPSPAGLSLTFELSRPRRQAA
jgi:hypothetical protein